jgi:DNA repair protein RadC
MIPRKAPDHYPEDTQPFFRLMRLADREYLMAILLDTGNRCVGLFIVNLGTRDSATVAIDAIIRSAILANAGGIILAHNHPSGQVNPSKQDEELLHTMERAGAPFKISILDMIVVGSIQDYSIQGKRRMSAPVFAQDVKMPVRTHGDRVAGTPTPATGPR